MTNFTTEELDTLWEMVESSVSITWNDGEGRKSAIKPKDAFLYMLCVLKHFTTWEKHAFDFHMKTVLFEKIVLKIIGIVEPVFYGILTQRLP